MRAVDDSGELAAGVAVSACAPGPVSGRLAPNDGACVATTATATTTATTTTPPMIVQNHHFFQIGFSDDGCSFAAGAVDGCVSGCASVGGGGCGCSDGGGSVARGCVAGSAGAGGGVDAAVCGRVRGSTLA